MVEFGDIGGGDGHVQPVVDDHPIFGLGLPGGQSVEQRLLRLGGHKVDDGCGAAVGCGACAGEEVVGGNNAAGQGHLVVNVNINRAGRDQFARGVDFSFAAEVGGDGDNLSIADADVGLVNVFGGDDGSVFNDEVELHKCSPFCVFLDYPHRIINRHTRPQRLNRYHQRISLRQRLRRLTPRRHLGQGNQLKRVR